MHLLEYNKLILQKVSFDRKLFEKELLKSKKVLSDHEVWDLQDWCMDKFKSVYPEVVVKCLEKEGKKNSS